MSSREPTERPSVALPRVLWTALALAVIHLSLVLGGALSGDSALALVRAVLGCALLPAAGLPAALLLVGRAAPRAPGRPVMGGAYRLVVLSLGFSLLLHYAMATALRAVTPPVTGWHLSLLSLWGVGLSLVLALRLRGSALRVMRVTLEPGLSGRAMALALVVAVVFAVAYRHRLFDGFQRMVISDFAHLGEDGERLRSGPRRARLAFGRGMTRLGPHRYRVSGPPATFALHNLTGEANQRLRLVLLLTARPKSGVELWRVPGAICGHPEDNHPARRVTGAVVPHEQFPPVAVYRGLLTAMLTMDRGVACYELRRTGPRGKPGMQITDLSHEDLSGQTARNGRLFFLASSEVECHFSDANYRAEMLNSQLISPNLLLWGYFMQFVAEVLAGGSYPMLGVLFLMLTLLCVAGVQVIMGGPELEPGRTRPPFRRHLAGALLVAPMLCHMASVVTISTQSFAFPDMPYTFFLVAAVAMLTQRCRVGFILLGCLAAYTRYPGAYVLAVSLFGWLAVRAGDRRWTLRTILLSVGAGLLVIVLLILQFHLMDRLELLFRSVYEEVYLEHYTVAADTEAAWLRPILFWAKLVVLSSLSLLLWPLAFRRRVMLTSKLLIVITVAYTLTLMSVQIPHHHYFQPLIYTTAGAGLGALARVRHRAVLVCGVVLVLCGLPLLLGGAFPHL